MKPKARTAGEDARDRVTPGAAVFWFQVSAQTAVFLAVPAACYGLDLVVAARTGRRILTRAHPHA